jgi:hypothetical protein
VKQGKTKSEAFKQIAEDTGKNSGTVAAAYYRVARAKGAVRPRQGRVKTSPTSTTRQRQRGAANARQVAGASSASVDQVVGQLIANVRALTKAVRAKDAEMRELRARLDKG